ncbi:hypothetical protein [Halogeometricum luteum]|uniref:Uncharacterized protein n=1 Tax=Halogeometricum luteum TaxID=2950537 RepID=A0ABU2FZB1_9EURY|nr:hypothetical protein [Halogeometricum sp. S3BR5-2]MDS0293855.1 hypothetical protein [Halogeometricum sp. S3BR5-2]
MSSGRLDDDVYEFIEARNRPAETFADTVARLADGVSEAELDELLHAGDVEAIREAVDGATGADETHPL